MSVLVIVLARIRCNWLGCTAEHKIQEIQVTMRNLQCSSFAYGEALFPRPPDDSGKHLGFQLVRPTSRRTSDSHIQKSNILGSSQSASSAIERIRCFDNDFQILPKSFNAWSCDFCCAGSRDTSFGKARKQWWAASCAISSAAVSCASRVARPKSKV